MPVDMQPHQGLYYYETSPSQPSRGIVPSDQSPYSDVSSLRAPLLDGPPQDCHAMYNPMTHGSGPGQGIGPCLDQYMRHPQAPPPHGMMGHRGMPPTEGGNSAPYCNQNMMSHHNFCQVQHGSDQIGSGDGSRFSTPRSMLKLSKKRALSISPLSDASVDLQTVIRTSPNSLVAFVNSRCNPNGASSYGHLSVSAMRSDITWFYMIWKSLLSSSVTPFVNKNRPQVKYLKWTYYAHFQHHHQSEAWAEGFRDFLYVLWPYYLLWTHAKLPVCNDR